MLCITYSYLDNVRFFNHRTNDVDNNSDVTTDGPCSSTRTASGEDTLSSPHKLETSAFVKDTLNVSSLLKPLTQSGYTL